MQSRLVDQNLILIHLFYSLKWYCFKCFSCWPQLPFSPWHTVSEHKSFSIWCGDKSWARWSFTYQRSSKSGSLPTCWFWEGWNPSLRRYITCHSWLIVSTLHIMSHNKWTFGFCFTEKLDRVNQLNIEISQLCRE